MERRTKRRKTEKGDGGARGARPRPAPEESTMENKKDDPFAVFCIVCRLLNGRTDQPPFANRVSREGSDAVVDWPCMQTRLSMSLDNEDG